MRVIFQHGFNVDRALLRFSERAFNAVHTDYGRRGDYGVRLFDASHYLLAPHKVATTKPVAAFAHRFISASGVNSRYFWKAREGTTVHLGLRRTSSGAIELMNGAGSQVAVSVDGIAPLDSTIFVVAEPFIDNAGTFKLWVDGALRINYSGDTQNGGTGSCDKTQFGHGVFDGSDTEFRLMDILIQDGTDGDFSLVHDVRFDRRNVDSDVSVQFTPSTGSDNFALVDEDVFSGTDYNHSSTVGHEDNYGVGSGTLSHPVISVAVVAQLSKAGGTAEAQIGLTDDGDQQLSASIPLSTTAAVYDEILDTRPGANGAWPAANNAVYDALTLDVVKAV